MSPTILLKIKKWLEQEKLLAQPNLDNFIEKLSYFNKGKWIYPGVFKRQLGISIKDVYKILHFLKSKGILEVYYEVYCYTCNKTGGDVYQTIAEIPEELYCEHCEMDLDLSKNVIMIYKVLEDGNK